MHMHVTWAYSIETAEPNKQPMLDDGPPTLKLDHSTRDVKLTWSVKSAVFDQHLGMSQKDTGRNTFTIILYKHNRHFYIELCNTGRENRLPRRELSLKYPEYKNVTLCI